MCQDYSILLLIFGPDDQQFIISRKIELEMMLFFVISAHRENREDERDVLEKKNALKTLMRLKQRKPFKTSLKTLFLAEIFIDIISKRFSSRLFITFFSFCLSSYHHGEQRTTISSSDI